MRFSKRFVWTDEPDLSNGVDEWLWAIPSVYRLAAGGSATNQPRPAPPGANSDHAQALGYWTALHYLLLYRLGWSRPDKGLQWWYEAGKPTEDPTLRLVSEIWDRDGLLDPYLAWTTLHPHVYLDPSWKTGRSSFDDADQIDRRWQRWATTVEGVQWFTPSEYDSLHLTGHSGEYSGDPGQLGRVDPQTRTGGYCAASFRFWYFDLIRQSNALPTKAPNSWKIDVVLDDVGSLGVYRGSYQTGLWFAGGHSIHAAGN